MHLPASFALSLVLAWGSASACCSTKSALRLTTSPHLSSRSPESLATDLVSLAASLAVPRIALDISPSGFPSMSSSQSVFGLPACTQE